RWRCPFRRHHGPGLDEACQQREAPLQLAECFRCCPFRVLAPHGAQPFWERYPESCSRPQSLVAPAQASMALAGMSTSY
ncbi:unnamed protein product, partial [Symbiodinium pilosum]